MAANNGMKLAIGSIIGFSIQAGVLIWYSATWTANQESQTTKALEQIAEIKTTVNSRLDVAAQINMERDLLDIKNAIVDLEETVEELEENQETLLEEVDMLWYSTDL